MSRGLDENNIFGSHVRCPDCNVIVATNQECSYCVRRAELSEKKQAEGQLLSEIQSQNDREEAALVKISKSGASGIVPKYIEDRLLYVELLLLAIWTTIDFVFFCSIGEPQAGLAICIAKNLNCIFSDPLFGTDLQLFTDPWPKRTGIVAVWHPLPDLGHADRNSHKAHSAYVSMKSAVSCRYSPDDRSIKPQNVTLISNLNPLS